MYQLFSKASVLLNRLRSKKLLFMGLGLFFISLIIRFPLEAQTKSPDSLPLGQYASFQTDGDIRRFVGETLHFDISFLWFQNAASAQVGFYKKGGIYYSHLVAKTKGFVGFFTSNRRHVYQTDFEIVNDGKRVRPLKFMRKVIEGGNEERADHFFDYNKLRHQWFQYQNGELKDTGIDEIPPGTQFDDVLTAFYNFRNGVYGTIRKGEKYTIKTIPEKGHDEISIQVRDSEVEDRVRKKEGRELADDLLVDILVPKSIFKTESGIIRLWASNHFIPLESTIKDYILLGDLHATFKTRVHDGSAGNRKTPSLSKLQ